MMASIDYQVFKIYHFLLNTLILPFFAVEIVLYNVVLCSFER
jgi:hypothetical protein